MTQLLITVIIGIVVGGALYRLRGGAFSDLSRRYGWEWGGKQRTQTMRLIWSLPTAAWIMFLWSQSWLIGAELVITVFASMALLGHGAHMVYDYSQLKREHWEEGKNDLELLTFWLPWAFDGKPNATWSEPRVFAFHMTGMSFIGIIRNAIAMLPFFFHDPMVATIYTVTGLLHGPIYWLGYKTPWKHPACEIFIGSFSWATIAILGSLV